MIQVKTFTTELKILHTMNELSNLDQLVNNFLKENGIERVVSVNDACTTDNSGATIGIIRVVAYER